jgi:hypothetical protein
MKSTFERRRALSVQIGDALVYLASYAPDNFPVDDHLTLEEVLNGVLADLRELMDASPSSAAKAELERVEAEVQAAWDLFRRGLGENGAEKLERLSDDFRDFESGRKAQIAFIAGADGIKKVED